MASGRLAKEQRALALRARRTGTGLATVADQFSLDTRVEFHMVSGVHLGLQEVREFEGDARGPGGSSAAPRPENPRGSARAARPRRFFHKRRRSESPIIL